MALEQRLAQLKSAGQTETAHPGPIVRVMSISDQSQMDQETAIQKIIEQTCAEVEMDSESQDVSIFILIMKIIRFILISEYFITYVWRPNGVTVRKYRRLYILKS